MKRLFTTLIVLSMAFTLVWAQNDLNLAFEDDGDVANWGVHGETNVWTAVAWDATAGVDGTGGIIFTDAGWDFLIKRPVAATLGAHFSLTVDVKNENFTGQTLYLKVEGLGTVEPEVALASESPDFISYTVSGIADIATDGYIRLYGAGGAEAKTVTIDNLVYNDDVPAVFFSEYIEGSSYNKALEIYNGSDEAVDLTAFAFPNVSNDPTVVGEYEYWNTFPEGASVAPGDVYVIAHGSADAAMLAEADFTFNFLSNGDDGFALVQGTEADFTVIDWIGDWNGDPGDGWDVAGVTEATKDHTLIRKADVMIGHTDWATSAGTDADNSEWIVMDQDFWGNLGDHPYAPMGMVTYSVDMSFQTELGFFIPGTDFLDVAGTLNDWGGGDVLTDDNADGIYEGTFEVATGAMEYKYRINGNWDTSENLPANRMWDVVDGANVIPTVWYSDQEPVVAVNVEVFIQVDMTVQLLNGNYDPGAGDLIVIRGGHDNFGNWGGAVEMLLDPEQTNIYTHLSAFDNVPIGSGYEYKFVILTGGDPDAAIWEGSDNRSFTATGEEVDSDENGYGEILQPVAYFADVTPDDIITQDVTVTFSVDISSAYRALANGDTLIDTQTGSDGIANWSEVNGVTINGVLSQWWDWGNDLTCIGEWAMTQGADEFHYNFSYLYTAGQAKMQQCKYGINSLDNEAGFAQNRDFMIDDASPSYALELHCFGDQNTDETLPLPQICGPIGPSLFFSEYIEGSSNNKGLEIYNATDATVNLDEYQIAQAVNGGGWQYYHLFPEGATLAAGDVWVIVTDEAFAEMQAVADEVLGYPSVVHHNGDDARAIIHVMGDNTQIVDLIGDPNNDPGDGWDVAGVTEATKDHTLIRKAAIESGNLWSYSAGTNADDSEWLVMDQNFIDGLGSHPYVPGNPVTFSVDMSFQATLGNFIPGTDFLDVAGTLNDWGGGDLLIDDNADGIYEGTFNVPTGAMEYKYRINGNWDTSENLPANRMWDVVDGANVIPTVWYSDQEPAPPTNVEVFIQVDMTVQLLNGNYDPGAGDLIVIRGGHDNFGNWGGAIEMTLDPEQTNIYTHLSAFDNVPIGSGYEYKFVILTGGDPDAAIWEGSDNRSFTATGEEVDSDENGYGEILQPVAYFADVTPDDIITQDVTVTFSVDISSAYHALAAGDTLYDTQTGSDGIGDWSEVNGVNINGILSQWWDWGNDLTCVGEWAMTLSEGTTYTFSYLYTAGQAKAQQCKYGINSLDNEAGFAMNRDFLIDDASPSYALELHCFGEQNTDESLPFPVDCAPVSIAELPGIPTAYALSQNYPNPFNPTTTINFALPEAGNVVLSVYNALGQEVRTLKTDYLNVGNYSVTWDGLDNAGNMIPSGIYIYTMTAGKHNFSKKMLMLK